MDSRPLWPTQNDLPDKVRRDTVDLLNPLDINSGREHVAALSAAIAKFGASARRAIDAANALGDADTADLFTEISRGIDKLLWKVEAHLQAKD